MFTDEKVRADFCPRQDYNNYVPVDSKQLQKATVCLCPNSTTLTTLLIVSGPELQTKGPTLVDLVEGTISRTAESTLTAVECHAELRENTEFSQGRTQSQPGKPVLGEQPRL